MTRCTTGSESDLMYGGNVNDRQFGQAGLAALYGELDADSFEDETVVMNGLITNLDKGKDYTFGQDKVV